MTALVTARTGQRGAALIMCLLMMAVLSLLAAGMVTNTVIALKVGGGLREREANFYAADGACIVKTAQLSTDVAAVTDVDAQNQQLDPPDSNLWKAVPANGPIPGYDYRILYLHREPPKKGYSQNSFDGFYYEVDCGVSGSGVAMSTINMKVGPKYDK